ncbi:DUF6160 family protein [Pseudomonas sp. JS3066]|uniref:DUF6160 family protein n=1 Tax=unclassified Pseudomonas TaxID=196821 RepID=UPI0024537565|nr:MULTISPECIES: DUF6160 family protein [unclassified Pseudomonas]WVK92304.1 DUF6160 family protein [Pseudomonas sp. JS3066]
MRSNPLPAWSLKAILLAGVFSSSIAQARMEELADSELSDITGQAFINLTTDANAGINYTRVNFGVNVDTQLNMKKLQLGQYDDSVTRAGEVAGSSDILINNFALGTVNADGSVNPFRIADPFVELAYSGNKVVGVRIGFGEAKGVLSGDIQSLTGNIPVHITGTAKPIIDKASGFDQFLLALAGISDSTRLQADATLVNSSGNADPVRGGMAGLTNGTALSCVSGCNLGGLSDALLSLFKSSGCGILSLNTCFPLSDFKSLPVGNISNMNTMEGAAKGFFISFQTQDLAWKDMDQNAFMTALKGAFMNMPKYRDANGNLVSPINIDFEQAFNGIPRQDTCLGTATAGC